VNIDAVFLPVAEQLINVEFGTDIVYHQHAIKAGVLSRGRVEAGGPNETYEILLWVHHGATGLGFLPTTADSFTYDAVVWKVVSVEPTYSSKSLIASKIKGRAS
jgi:hypothetical protein